MKIKSRPLDVADVLREHRHSVPPAPIGDVAGLGLRVKRVPRSSERVKGEPHNAVPAELAVFTRVAGLPLSQIRDALGALASQLPPPQTRADRAARWVLRGELRKMAVLDQYLSGYIKG